MDYEKKYNDALAEMKVIYPNLNGDAKKAVEHAFPELTESEDERIRKFIAETVFRYYGDSQEYLDVLAYLEKQKEQKPSTPEDIAAAYQMGLAEGRKEQKPAEWSDSVAKEMFIKALERAVEQTKNGYELTDCDKHSWWEDFKAYSGIKPAECIEDSVKFEEGFKTGREVGFREGVKNVKSAEWSEEDEKIMEDIIFAIREVLQEKDANRMIAKLKFLCPQSKQEWSEEDEAAFGDLMWCIEQARKSAKDENDMGNVWFAENWVKNRLKSLRPQPEKESVEEKTMNFFDAIGDCGFTQADILNLKSIWKECGLPSPQPHWKPTKVQLDALAIASERVDSSPLKALYNDLQKLM